jgi:hypothetical protein
MNFRLKEQASGFQFQQKLGVGVRCAISKNTALIVELNGYHISNADLRKPNVGLNHVMFAAGINRTF